MVSGDWPSLGELNESKVHFILVSMVEQTPGPLHVCSLDPAEPYSVPKPPLMEKVPHHLDEALLGMLTH